MKALVLREETLREAVPTKARFVDDRRRDHVHIGQRNKLNPRRRDRVKPRELTPTRCQRHGEGLRAIAKEIPAGQNVVLVEVVIDLGN